MKGNLLNPQFCPDFAEAARNASCLKTLSIPKKCKEPILMKTILLTVVLGVSVMAGAQGAAQPAAPPTSGVNPPTGSVDPRTGSVNPPTGAVNPPTGQAAQSTPAAAPVIKDPAEYNAYVGAIKQTDPAAQISGLEAFMTQYPNSVMKVSALETLMGDYQKTNNSQKTIDTATKLVAADPNNVRGMALLAYFDRLKAQGGDPQAVQLLADAKKYGQMGLDSLPKFQKPDGTSDADFQKMKDQMSGIFNAAIGIADLTAKDYDDARKTLRIAADGNPTDFSVVYPLALAYAGPTPADPKTPPDSLNAIWYATRASIVAPTPQYQQQIEKYAKNQYMKYHGADDGWTDLLAQAKANPAEPAGFTIKPAPTPPEQAHNMVVATPPDKMDFATWEFVLQNGKQEDQDAVWNAIKGKPVYMNGTVIKATAAEFDIAASSDDIDAKKADITLTFEEKVPLRLIPKEGASLDFQGEPASYTPNPFMMVMDKGLLPKPKTAPKTTTHHKAASQ
jgi:tetratricopeptide (TPR) repeat protein